MSGRSLEDLMNGMTLRDRDHEAMIYEMLDNDIRIIISCHTKEKYTIFQPTHLLHIGQLLNDAVLTQTFFKMFYDEQMLFKYINFKLFVEISNIDFLDICPLIDEYIEYIFQVLIKYR